MYLKIRKSPVGDLGVVLKRGLMRQPHNNSVELSLIFSKSEIKFGLFVAY